MSETQLLILAGSVALKGGVILVVAAVVNAAWRTASAAARHLVWTLAVSASLVLPIVIAAIARTDGPRIEIGIWHPQAPAAPVAQEVDPAVDPASVSASIPETRDNDRRPATFGAASTPSVNRSTLAAFQSSAALPAAPPSLLDILARNWRRDLLWLWIGGAVLSLLPLLAAVIRIRFVASNARRVTHGRWQDLLTGTPALAHLADRITIVESDDAAMPMTWGIRSPTLLVPSRAEEWPDWQCRNILLHELGHIERRDCMTQLIAQLACAVYWFNPLSWVAAHRMRVERELACDDRVITAGSRASEYAANLLEVARSLRAPSYTSQTAIAMARPSQLSGRLLAVLDSKRNRQGVTHRMTAATSAVAFAALLPLASLTPAVAATVSEASPASMPVAEAPPASQATSPASFATFPAGAPAIIRAAQLPATGIIASAEAPVSSLTGPAETALLAVPLFQERVCWDDTDGKNSVSISNHEESGATPSWTVRYSSDNCSMELRAEGKFTLRADLSDLESLSSDGWFRVEEREGRSSRRMEIRRGGNGALDHQYWINGDRAPYDADARAWLARTLLSVERRTAFAADTRVPQLYRTGGLNTVLAEISRMPSAYAKSRYFGTMLDMRVALDASTLNNIVSRASTELASSDYYMSEVLGKLGSQTAANETTWRTFAEAAGRMKSDYYKSQTLTAVLSKGKLSPETVGTLLRSASGIKSDYYLTEVLKNVRGKYALNSETRPYYVDALRHVESDYYRSELLRAMDTDDTWDAKTSSFVLTSVGDIKSDYYKSTSLVSLVNGKHVVSWPEYFNAAGSIGSDYYKKEAITAPLRQSPVTRDVVAGILSVAAKMRSDSEIADVLGSVARNYRIDESLRPAFEKAIDAMGSEYYRGSALSALRRSMDR